MINISQIISILCLHSTYITHKFGKKKEKKRKQEINQTRRFIRCPVLPDQIPLHTFRQVFSTLDT